MSTNFHVRCRLAPLLVGAACLWWTAAASRAADEDEILPLPTWTQQDVIQLSEEPDAIPLGGFLWPEGFNPDSLVTPESRITRTPPGGFLLFIPKTSAQVLTQSQSPATPPHSLVDVSSDFLRECEALEPGSCLLDPHALLPETQSEDLNRLLAYHIGEAQTFAHVLLLDSDEQLPRSADLSRIAQGRLTQDHGCLIVYALAEPWRARIFMTHAITRGVSPDYLRGILQACIQDAMQASDPVEQLQRFATQLSIRLIWMERAHPEIFAPAEEVAAAQPAVAPSLAEVAHAPALAEIFDAPVIPWRTVAIIGSSAFLALMILILVVRAIIRSRRRHARNSVWLLPEVEVQPRFGAPHCGQGGSWIRYG